MPDSVSKPLDIAGLLRIQACANRLANRRLQGALKNLSTAELHARRTSFFPTIIGTLNHLLAVDHYYLAALHGEPDMAARHDRFAPHDELVPYAAAQDRSDLRLIAFCDKLDAAGANADVALDRGEGKVVHDPAALVLQHLFMHQTHHRGQVHSMLSGTAVKPPQLDEFILRSDSSLRVMDMSGLGWTEADVYG